jgi:hypothetical protein
MIKSLSKAVAFLDGVKVVTEMLALPTFWFGGPWVATRVLASVRWERALPWYIAFLAFPFFLIACVPFFRFVLRMARDTQGN